MKVSQGARAFPRRIEGIGPSPTVALGEVAGRMKAEGQEVIDLTMGEPDFDTPQFIVRAAQAALEAGFTHYVPSRGLVELRQAIARKLERRNGLFYDPDQEIVVTLGAKQALFSAILATIEEGDEVLILDPSWVSYDPCVRLAGGVPVHVALSGGDNFLITADLLKPHLSPRTRMVMVNSPGNPTGRVLTEDELQAVASLAEEADLLVLSDEIYEKLVYDGRQHVSVAGLPGMRNRTIVVNGFSKAYAMTGWRLGYLAAPVGIVDTVIKVHQHTVTCATSFGQKAAVVALDGPQDELRAMVTEFRARRDLLCEGLDSIRDISCELVEGAFYAFPEISALGLPSSELAERLLLEGGVATVPGIAFGAGCDGHLRLCFAASRHELEDALERIRSVVERI
jgi:aspartate aminotransferase